MITATALPADPAGTPPKTAARADRPTGDRTCRKLERDPGRRPPREKGPDRRDVEPYGGFEPRPAS